MLSNRRLLAAAILAAASQLPAQDITYANPNPTLVGFGTNAVILGDSDGLGRRDVVIATIDNTTTPPTALVDFISTETGAVIGTASFGPATGSAMVNVGDFDGNGADDVAIASPTLGFITIHAGETGASFSIIGVVVLPAPFSAGGMVQVEDFNNDGIREIAVGDPAANAVHIVDLTIANPNNPVLQTITDPRIGSFGAALASSGNRLAVGAPTFSTILPPGPTRGYVNIFRIGATTATLTATITGVAVPGVPREFGRALAVVGDQDADGLDDFAVLAPSDAVNAFAAILSETNPNPFGQFFYGVPSVAGQGRMTAAGDLNADGSIDIVVSDGASLHLLATQGPAFMVALTAAPIAGAFNGCVAGGPSITGVGIQDVVLGRNINATTASAQVAPIAAAISLPNPPACVISQNPVTQRSLLGTNPFTLDLATTSTTPVLGFMVVDFAPATSVPFGNGLAYINMSSPTAQILGFNGVVNGAPLSFVTSIPASPAFLNIGLVFQGATIDAAGAFQMSNGFVFRLGSF
ncbi:MAG: VCBS repeat-containing protein [Planctomycetes bacterium]|nr:VCBS repeat-containing protein [Planctomycetota bacterium]